MSFKAFLNILIIGLMCFQCTGQETNDKKDATKVVVKPILKQPAIQVAAERTDKYLPLLQGKKVGVVGNHTSQIGKVHLVDSLIRSDVNVLRVFSPEHGFRGKADAGEKVNSDTDPATGLPIISLYGKNKKPAAHQVNDLDVIVFDIQDVGARFYTYISTMHYVMEACAENGVKMIVLDRPNPNGHYVDGPVLDKKFTSFVGMHPVPIVHGMTIGEYATMINGEGWLDEGIRCDLKVIKVKNYDHQSFYKLPQKPSPNLPTMASVYLYPSLCLFEGTPVSIGRGTDKPFQIVGHPSIQSDKFSFTPQPTEGAKDPKLNGEKCFGWDLTFFGEEYLKKQPQLNLFWLLDVYKSFPEKENFFKDSFNRLAGTDRLQQQIKDGVNEQDIYRSWQKDLVLFKKIRKKYLLYKDFE